MEKILFFGLAAGLVLFPALGMAQKPSVRMEQQIKKNISYRVNSQKSLKGWWRTSAGKVKLRDLKIETVHSGKRSYKVLKGGFAAWTSRGIGGFAGTFQLNLGKKGSKRPMKTTIEGDFWPGGSLAEYK